VKAVDNSIEAVAELLPPERRERFFALISRFENVPEDDEHLRILEAMGFLTLIMKAIPIEIAETVRKSHSGLDDSQRKALQADMETILKDSIDTPSYKDLRGMVDAMKEENHRFDDRVGKLMEWLRERVPDPNPDKPRWIDRAIGFAIASVLFGVAYTLVPGSIIAPAARETALGSMERKGILQYFEDKMPEYGGKVGVIVATEALHATSRDGKGILIVLPQTL
jgi:hypothetical protein